MDFTAIDFETANCARGSICAVGLVRVENGKTVATLNTLVDPRAHFDWRCMNVHGITPDDVRGGNRLDELAQALGIGGFRHHDAFEDAAVCAEIFKIFETRTNVNAFKKRFFPPF